MKNLTLFSLLFLFVAVLFSCHKRPFTADFASADPEVLEGQVLYMNYCNQCHPNGESGLGPSVYYLPGFAKRFQVRHGLGVMPDFDKEVISKEQLDKIILYLDALDDAS